jgi:hypothetical protein
VIDNGEIKSVYRRIRPELAPLHLRVFSLYSARPTWEAIKISLFPTPDDSIKPKRQPKQDATSAAATSVNEADSSVQLTHQGSQPSTERDQQPAPPDLNNNNEPSAPKSIDSLIPAIDLPARRAAARPFLRNLRRGVLPEGIKIYVPPPGSLELITRIRFQGDLRPFDVYAKGIFDPASQRWLELDLVADIGVKINETYYNLPSRIRI